MGDVEYQIHTPTGGTTVRFLALFAALSLATLGSACAARTTANPFQGGVDGERTIEVEIRNLNFADATIYAFRGTERIRLGVVTGKTDEAFRVAWTLNQPLRIQIDLLAGARCTTRAMDVAPGEVVQVEVPSDLARAPDCT